MGGFNKYIILFFLIIGGPTLSQHWFNVIYNLMLYIILYVIYNWFISDI